MCIKLLDLSWDLISELLGLVTGYMSYRPCEEDYLQALYMVYKYTISLLVCVKRFLKSFTDYIVIHEDGYPEYYY
jgi:hypothetical protein